MICDSPLAGELFPQGDLGGRLFDDVHGAGWRLVTADGDPDGLDTGLVGWFAGLGGAVVAAPGLVGWFARHGVRWALQRPDFHLFGTAADAVAAVELLADLRRQIAPPPTPDPETP